MWPYIKYGLHESKPAGIDFTELNMRNVLMNLLIGKAQCWAIVNPDEEDSLYGFALTSVSVDDISGNRFLNIYDLFSFKPLQKNMLEEGISALTEFAKANECKKMSAYTMVPSIVSMAKTVGFTASYTFLLKEL